MKNITKTILASAAVALMASCSEKVDDLAVADTTDFSGYKLTVAASAPQSVGRAGLSENFDSEGVSLGTLNYEFDYDDEFYGVICNTAQTQQQRLVWFDVGLSAPKAYSIVSIAPDPEYPDDKTKAIFTFESPIAEADAQSTPVAFSGVINKDAMVHIFTKQKGSTNLPTNASSGGKIGVTCNQRFNYNVGNSTLSDGVRTVTSDGMFPQTFNSGKGGATLLGEEYDNTEDDDMTNDNRNRVGDNNNILDYIYIAGTTTVQKDINLAAGEYLTIDLGDMQFDYLTSLLRVRLINSGEYTPTGSNGQLKPYDREFAFCPGLLGNYTYFASFTNNVAVGDQAAWEYKETTLVDYTAMPSTVSTASEAGYTNLISACNFTAATGNYINATATSTSPYTYCDTYFSFICDKDFITPVTEEGDTNVLMKASIWWCDQLTTGTAYADDAGHQTVFTLTTDMIEDLNPDSEGLFEAGKFYQVTIDLSKAAPETAFKMN